MGIEALIRGEMTVRAAAGAARAPRRPSRRSGRRRHIDRLAEAGPRPASSGERQCMGVIRRDRPRRPDDGVRAAGPAGAVPARRRRRRGRARVDPAPPGRAGRHPACCALARSGRRAAPARGVRAALPQPGRARRRDGQGRGGAAGLAGARVRLRRGRARSPGTPSRATTGRGCSGCATRPAVVNRMGFNNAGAAALAAPAGARLGRPARTAGHQPGQVEGDPAGPRRVEDYLASLRARCYPYGDYFAVNVSSPNTPGLRTCRTGPSSTSCWARCAGRHSRAARPADAGQDRARPDRRARSPRRSRSAWTTASPA